MVGLTGSNRGAWWGLVCFGANVTAFQVLFCGLASAEANDDKGRRRVDAGGGSAGHGSARVGRPSS